MNKKITVRYNVNEAMATAEYVSKNNPHSFSFDKVWESLTTTMSYIEKRLQDGDDISFSGTMGYLVHIESDDDVNFFLSFSVVPSYDISYNYVIMDNRY